MVELMIDWMQYVECACQCLIVHVMCVCVHVSEYVCLRCVHVCMRVCVCVCAYVVCAYTYLWWGGTNSSPSAATNNAGMKHLI